MLWKDYWLILKHALLLSCPAVSKQYSGMRSLSREIFRGFFSLLRSAPIFCGQQRTGIDKDILLIIKW